MKKVLLVGGAGYVGSVLANELLAQGYSVRIVDNLYYGKDGLEGIEDKVELVVDDIRTIGSDVLLGIDGIINLSGFSNDPTAAYNPELNYEMNTVATERLARLAKDNGIARYVFASSGSIYDCGVEDGTLDIIQDETSEVYPVLPYSKSKYDAERLLIDMADEEFCPVILRKGTIFGYSNRMRYDLVVNTFVKYAMSQGYLRLDNGGEMWRPMVSVRDVAQAYIAALEAPAEKVSAEVINVSNRNYRISELGLRTREALRNCGVEVDLRMNYNLAGPVRSYRMSNNKAKDLLGFDPKHQIDEEVTTLIQKIQNGKFNDYDNPIYYNIQWMKLLEEKNNRELLPV